MLSSISLRIAILGAVALAGAMGLSDDDRELGITGSKHDFVRLGVTRENRCLPCHNPWSPEKESQGALWDKSPDAMRRYKLYRGSLGMPGSASLVCLGCHDGSSALDAFRGMLADVEITDLANRRPLVGRNYDLSGDHPVGVAYPVLDRKFRAKSVVEGGGFVYLPEGRVECVSCHDPHSQYSIPKLLVKSNVRSALCLTCHRK